MKNHHTSKYLKFLGRGIVIRTAEGKDSFFKMTGIAWKKDGSEVLLGTDHEGMSTKVEGAQIIKTWSQA